MDNDNRSANQAERRKELNRQAAQKLRNRQKEKAITAKQEYFTAQSRNTQLSYEVKQLRKRKETLQWQLNNHLQSCVRATKPAPASGSVHGIMRLPVAAAAGASTKSSDVLTDLSSLISGTIGGDLSQTMLFQDGDNIFQVVRNGDNIYHLVNVNSLPIAGGNSIEVAMTAAKIDSDLSLTDTGSKVQIVTVESDRGTSPTLLMEVDQQATADENEANDETASDEGSIVIALDNDNDVEEQSSQPSHQLQIAAAEMTLTETDSEKVVQQPEPASAAENSVDSVPDNSADETAIAGASSEDTAKAMSPSKQKSETVTRRSGRKRRDPATAAGPLDGVVADNSPDCTLPLTVSSLTADD